MGGLSLGFLLRADSEQAEAAIKRVDSASERAAAAIEGHWSAASAGIHSALSSLVGPLGVVTAGFAALGGTMLALAARAAEYGESIYNASIKTGLTAAQLSGMAAVSKETGESFESLTMALGRASRSIGAALATPTATSAKLIFELAGGAENLKKIIAERGGTGEAIEMLLKRIFALGDITQRNLALQTLFGRGWMQNTVVLQRLAKEGFGAAEEEARKLGMLMDDRAAARAHVFAEEMNTMRATVEGLALKVGQTLIPVLQQLFLSFAGLKASAQEFGLVLKAIALDPLTPWKTTAWKEAAEKPKEAFEAIRAAAEEMQKAMSGALKNLSKDAKGATLDLSKLHEKTRELTEAEKEEADRLELATAKLQGYVHWLEVATKIQARWVDEVRMTEKEYQHFVTESMSKEAERIGASWDAATKKLRVFITEKERMEKQARESEKIGEKAPSIGEKEGVKDLGLDPEQTRRTIEGTDRLSGQIKKLGVFTKEAAEQWKEYQKAIKDKSGLDLLTQAVEQIIVVHRQGLPLVISLGKALRDEGEAAEESAKKQIAANAQMLLSHLIGRKAMAVIEAVVETARGIADLAFPPKPWSAAMHFMSAAEWGIIAGTGGGSKGGGGGGGGSGSRQAETPGVSGIPGVTGGGSRGGGGSPSSRQVFVNIYGGAITDTHNLQNLTSALNSGGSTGTVRLNTGGSSYSIPSPAY